MSTLSKIDFKESCNDPFMRVMWIYYFAMAILALLIPDDILSSHAWAREFSDFMASIVPQIDRITALNIKPDVNRFYFSVLWAGVPPTFFYYLIVFTNGRKHHYPIWTAPLPKALLQIAIMSAFIYLSYHMLDVIDISNRQLRYTLANSISRAILGGATFVYGSPLFGAGIVVIILGWITGYIPRNIQAQKLKEQEHD